MIRNSIMIVTLPVKMDFNMLSKMLRIIVFSSLVFLQSTNAQTAESGPSEHLVGKVNLADFQQQPHKQWFDKHYGAHTLDLDILKEIKFPFFYWECITLELENR